MNDKEKADKERHDKERQANTTLSPQRDPAPRSAAEQFNVPADELLTEQEKAAAAGGEGAGVGPISASEVSPGPVETIEDQGIGPRTPYPEGNPPPVHEETIRSQGINKGRDDRAVPKPDKPLPKEHR